MASYYDVLGVSAFADVDEVRRAYYRKAQVLHPDRFAAAPEVERRRAEDEMKTVNEAWNTLRNPETRRRHDAEIGLTGGYEEEEEEEEDFAEGLFWEDDGEAEVSRPSLLRRQGVRLAVVAVLVAGLVVSAVAWFAPGGNSRGRWTTEAVDDMRTAAINAGMTSAQADCFVDTITGRYSPSDEIDRAMIQQVADGCR
jgi:curved DNA-binding protein CbpA